NEQHSLPTRRSSDLDNEYVKKVKEFSAQDEADVIVISAKIEEEIAELSSEEKDMYLEELGIKQSGLDILIKATYDLLGYGTYFTDRKSTRLNSSHVS